MTEIMTIEDAFVIPGKGVVISGVNSSPNGGLEHAKKIIGSRIRIRSRRLSEGRWALDKCLRGRVWFEIDDGPGHPSRWVTLRALRVLKWWNSYE